MADATTATETITPFHLAIPDAELGNLRDRLRRTRWPEAETVDDWSQGIPLAYVRELCTYWASGYDWRARAATGGRPSRPTSAASTPTTWPAST